MNNFREGEHHTEYHPPLILSYWKERAAATRTHADRVDITIGQSFVGSFRIPEEDYKWAGIVSNFKQAYEMGKIARSKEIASLIGVRT